MIRLIKGLMDFLGYIKIKSEIENPNGVALLNTIENKQK